VASGVVIVVAAWMLDPAACAGMSFGAPCVGVSALVELHQLLIPPSTSPRQLSIPFDSSRLRGMTPSERGIALARLAGLLLEAAGAAAGRDDDER
jgi:hypothetical protein